MRVVLRFKSFTTAEAFVGIRGSGRAFHVPDSPEPPAPNCLLGILRSTPKCLNPEHQTSPHIKADPGDHTSSCRAAAMCYIPQSCALNKSLQWSTCTHADAAVWQDHAAHITSIPGATFSATQRPTCSRSPSGTKLESRSLRSWLAHVQTSPNGPRPVRASAPQSAAWSEPHRACKCHGACGLHGHAESFL